MKKSRRFRKIKKRKYTRKHKKTRRYGGNKNINYPFKNPTNFKKNSTYLIKFYNDEDNDDIESEFSPSNDGLYKYIDKNTLYPYHSNKIISYYVFERNDENMLEKNGEQIYLFYDDEPITYNNIITYFQMPYHYINGIIHGEKPTYLWSDEYLYENRPSRYRCNVYMTYTQTDLDNVSRVARKNPSKELPIEMERNIQSFMVGKTIYDK